MDRRHFLASALAISAAPSLSGAEELTPAKPAGRGNRIGVSSYSFWGFKRDDLRPMDRCVELAAEMGFDGLEILQRQLVSTEPADLMKIIRRAFLAGLAGYLR